MGWWTKRRTFLADWFWKIFISVSKKKGLNTFSFKNQCAELIILGRVQFGVHVGFISTLSCRSDICIFLTYNLQAHLHFALKAQAITSELLSNMLVDLIQMSNLEIIILISNEILNRKWLKEWGTSIISYFLICKTLCWRVLDCKIWRNTV